MSPKLIILLIVALFATSSSAILARMLPDMHPAVIAFWRVFIAGSILWIYSIIVPQGSIKREGRGTIVFAGILLGFHFACFFQAIKLTTVANATLFSTIPPLFTALVERFFLKRSWNTKIILGLIFAFAGLTVVFSNQLSLDAGHKTGIGFAVLGSVFLSAVWLMSERIRQTTESVVYIRTLFLSASLPLVFLSFLADEKILNIGNTDIAWLTALAILPTVFGHGLYNHALKFIRPTVVASFPLGEPIIATVLAYLIFGEPIGLLWTAGGIITLSGLVMITLNQ